jgi:hypothetical protein
MIALLARVGHVQARTAAVQTARRKRREWVCWECRVELKAGRLQRRLQRRWYGDESVGSGGEDILTPLVSEDRKVEKDGVRTSHGERAQRPRQGLGNVIRSSDGIRMISLGDGADGGREYDDGGNDLHDDAVGSGGRESRQEKLWESFEQYSERDPDERQVAPEEGAISADYANAEAARRLRSRYQRFGTDLLNLDYRRLMPSALANREMDLVARCLFSADLAGDVEFITSIDSDSHLEILKIMEPANNIDKLLTTHLELHEKLHSHYGTAPMKEVAYEYGSFIWSTYNLRRKHHGVFTVDHYAVLLRSARDLGYKSYSREIWKHLLMSGYLPTTECWNYYLAAALFDSQAGAWSHHGIRVTPFNMLQRKGNTTHWAFSNYRVGRGGIKETIETQFKAMLKDGATANGETYRIVMTAAAREGDIDTVKLILRKVWNVDVASVMSGAGEENPPKQIDPDSPYYPTEDLLFAVGHAFSINNDIPTALRLVDYIARHYNLPLTRETWAMLFEGTFVLAASRSGTAKRNAIGKLPRERVLDLWNAMTSEPYNVQPTMGMYNILIKNLLARKMLDGMLEKMLEASLLSKQHRDERDALWVTLQDEIVRSERQPGQSHVQKARREWEHADLIVNRNFFWLKRWVALLMRGMKTFIHRQEDASRSEDWALRILPKLLREFAFCTPRYPQYDTLGGIVQFEFRDQHTLERRGRFALRRTETQRAWLDHAPRLLGEDWTHGTKRLEALRRGPMKATKAAAKRDLVPGLGGLLRKLGLEGKSGIAKQGQRKGRGTGVEVHEDEARQEESHGFGLDEDEVERIVQSVDRAVELARLGREGKLTMAEEAELGLDALLGRGGEQHAQAATEAADLEAEVSDRSWDTDTDLEGGGSSRGEAEKADMGESDVDRKGDDESEGDSPPPPPPSADDDDSSDEDEGKDKDGGKAE